MAIHDAWYNNKLKFWPPTRLIWKMHKANQLDSALLDRLELNPARFAAMLQGLKDVAQLDLNLLVKLPI